MRAGAPQINELDKTLGGGDRHRPANRLSSLGSGNDDWAGLMGLRVVYCQQLRLGDRSHRIRYRFVNACIQSCPDPEVADVEVQGLAHLAGRRIDAAVEPCGTLRTR